MDERFQPLKTIEFWHYDSETKSLVLDSVVDLAKDEEICDTSSE